MNNNAGFIKLLPIGRTMDENRKYAGNPDCAESLQMVIDFYLKIGYNPPWIGYYAEYDGILVGMAGFKGEPVNGKVEIAYGTFEKSRNTGIGTKICQALIHLARKTDPLVKITARTLPERNFSTRILDKNGFKLQGTVLDPEDGIVFEWILE